MSVSLETFAIEKTIKTRGRCSGRRTAERGEFEEGVDSEGEKPSVEKKIFSRSKDFVYFFDDHLSRRPDRRVFCAGMSASKKKIYIYKISISRFTR